MQRQHARVMESPILKEWFTIMVPHVDGKWLLEAFHAKAEDEPIRLLTTHIPKNCVFVQSTTVGNTRNVFEKGK